MDETMTPESVMTMGQKAMEVTLMISAPLLLVALLTGLLVSIFQAATQINEMTLSFIPKLVALFAALVLAGPWMLSVMIDYMRQVLEGIPALVS
jgi:flagellar biosynthetic protein FliQ